MSTDTVPTTDTTDTTDEQLMKKLEDFKTSVKNFKNKAELKVEMAKYVFYNEKTQLVESLTNAGFLFSEGKVRVKAMNFCTKKYNHANDTEYKWR